MIVRGHPHMDTSTSSFSKHDASEKKEPGEERIIDRKSNNFGVSASTKTTQKSGVASCSKDTSKTTLPIRNRFDGRDDHKMQTDDRGSDTCCESETWDDNIKKVIPIHFLQSEDRSSQSTRHTDPDESKRPDLELPPNIVRREISNMSSLASDMVYFNARAAKSGPSLGKQQALALAVLLLHAAVTFLALVVSTQGGACGDTVRWKHDVDHVDVPDGVEMYRSYAKKIVPDLQDFYRGQESVSWFESLGSESVNDTTRNRRCTHHWMQQYLTYTSSFNGTQIRQVDITRLLEILGIEHVESIRVKLEPLVQYPHIGKHFLSQVEMCANQNDYLVEMSCVAWDLRDTMTAFAAYDGYEDKWRMMFTFAVVVEILTRSAIEDPQFLANLFEEILGSDRQQRVLRHLIDNDRYSSFEKEFYEQKTNTIFHSARSIVDRMMTDGGQSRYEALWLNIMEAAYVDFHNGFRSNVVVGLGLNRHLNRMSYFKDEGHFRWKLTKKWVDTYIAWNMAFVAQFAQQESMWILLVPSVLCTSFTTDQTMNSVNPEVNSFAIARIVSLLLRITAYDRLIEPEGSYGLKPKALIEAFGDTIVRHFQLGEVHKNDAILENMFVRMCPTCVSEWSISRTGPMEYLDDEWYQIFVTLASAITVFGTGIGMELIIGFWWLERLSETDTARLWRFAEFCFPILGLVPILGHSSTTLLIAAIGVFKFGFPEIVMYTTLSTDYFKNKHWWGAIAAYANALGLLLHHFCSIYVVCALNIGFWTLTRELSTPLILLVVIHWFVLIRYTHHSLYTALILAIDVIFQWEVLSNLQQYCLNENQYYDRLGPGIALGMLAAHELYILAGFIELVQARLNDREAAHVLDSSNGQETVTPNLELPPEIIFENRKVRRYPKIRRLSLTKFSRHHVSG